MAHGGGRVCREARAGRRDLVPCAGAEETHPAPGVHLGGRLRSRGHRAVIAGKRPTPEIPDEAPPSQRINLIIDIQERLSQGKGPAYERWAKVYNLKQMAAALQYLREHELGDYDALAAKTSGAVDRFHALAGELRDTEAALARTSRSYGGRWVCKNRPVFDGYKAARYGKNILPSTKAELASYRAAKATLNDILAGASSQDGRAQKSRRELAEKKKKGPLCGIPQGPGGYAEAAIKANIDVCSRNRRAGK